MSGVSKKTLALMAMILFIIIPFAAMAQSTTEGAVAGTVYDVQGAVVPDATVTVRNIGTNAQQTVTADGSGYFRVIRLQPAVYEVTVAASGFAPFKVTSVTVNVGTITEISPRLKPAGSTETVEVLGEAPQINTSSAEFAPVVNEVQIQNLPINGSRWSNFVMLTPGIVSDSSGFGMVSVRGMSTLQNNNTIDGADNNQAFFAEERGRTRAGYSTPKAAIQEFQVNTSGYSAEYGRAAGGVFNVVSKSGTNTLHGEAYFYDRDNAWGAMNPFTTITTKNTDGSYTPKAYKPKDWRKIAGVSVGGPIIKDKLFFNFTYDYFHRNFPGTGIASSPGSFFAAPTAANLTTLATRLGITSAQAQALYDDDLSDLITTIGPTAREGEQTIFFPKIDWQINNSNHMSFVFNRMRWASPAGIQTQATNTYGIRSFGNDYVKITWGVLKLNTTITNNIVNEFRTQYGRDFEYQTPQVPTGYEQSNLVQSAIAPTYANPYGLPPEVTITNGWNLGVANFLTRPKYPDERRQQYADTMTWSIGKHLTKFGIDFTHVTDDTENLRYQYGSFSYSSLVDYFTDLHGANRCQRTIRINNVDTQVMTPCYSSLRQGFGPMGFKMTTKDYGLFIQDDWKVMPRLTLTMGLRWDYEQLPEPFNNLVNNTIPETGRMPKDYNNFGPRVGVAWDLFGDGRTSLRGGYALVYGRVINSTVYNALINTGVMPGGQGQYTFSTTSATTHPCALPFPQIHATFEALSAISGGACARAAGSAVFFQKDFQLPKVHHVNVSLERQIANNTVLQLNYLGAFGRNLVTFIDTNIAPSTTTYAYKVTGGPLDGETINVPIYTQRKDSHLPVAQRYGAKTRITSDSDSTYHALVVQLNRRMSNHLQFNTNFTWSHAIDYGQNNTTFSSENGVLDPYNLAAEKGNSNQNVPLRFVFNAVAESPWKLDGPLGWFTNNWQIAPVYQWQNGLPYSARTTGNAPSSLSGGINGSNGDFRVPGTRNQFRYPDTHVVDVKISKLIRYKERYSAEFSGEFFNVLNHQNVTQLNTTAYRVGGTAAAPTLTFNAPFQTVTNSNSNFAYRERQIQLGVKVKF